MQISWHMATGNSRHATVQWYNVKNGQPWFFFFSRNGVLGAETFGERLKAGRQSSSSCLRRMHKNICLYNFSHAYAHNLPKPLTHLWYLIVWHSLVCVCVCLCCLKGRFPADDKWSVMWLERMFYNNPLSKAAVQKAQLIKISSFFSRRPRFPS